MKLFLPFLVLAAFCLGGCATHVRAPSAMNPPPGEPFARFGRVELRAVQLTPALAGRTANQHALIKIQQNVSLKMNPELARWNSENQRGAPNRTLVIDPVVTDIKFIGGNARFWVGPIAGSSAVVLTVRIYEKETGKAVANPVFYARGSAMGGTFTIGATDNIMLTRVADRFSSYLKGNFADAVGGPTGAVTD